MNEETNLAEQIKELVKRVENLEHKFEKNGITVSPNRQINFETKVVEMPELSEEQQRTIKQLKLQATEKENELQLLRLQIAEKNHELANINAEKQQQQVDFEKKEKELLVLLQKFQEKLEHLQTKETEFIELSEEQQRTIEQLEKQRDELRGRIYELQPSAESLMEQDAEQIKISLAKASFEQIIETAKNEFGILELQTFENEFDKVYRLIISKINQL